MNVQECDATKLNSTIKAGNIIKYHTFNNVKTTQLLFKAFEKLVILIFATIDLNPSYRRAAI